MSDLPANWVQFEKDVSAAANRNSIDADCDMPDFVIGRFARRTVHALNMADYRVRISYHGDEQANYAAEQNDKD